MIGKVFLIGAGPGDPGLLTLKGKSCLELADIIVYDRLVSPEIVQLGRSDAERIYVGKEPNQHIYQQSEINQLLVNKAKDGHIVARLKGGDPFVFGRGAEEAEELIAHGIPFEVIPGITSAIAAPAYAGIPVTHRKFASGFHVVTGHECLSSPGVNWSLLTETNQTLVILMGLSHLHEITLQLIQNGRDQETPVGVIQWGTTPEQKVVTGTLRTIERLVKEQGITHPAVIVVGDVVRLNENLRWFRSSFQLQN